MHETNEEANETEIGADGNPKRRQRVLNEAERQVDDRDGEGEDSDDPCRRRKRSGGATWRVKYRKVPYKG